MSPSSWIVVAAVVLVASPDFILDRVGQPAPPAGRARTGERVR